MADPPGLLSSYTYTIDGQQPHITVNKFTTVYSPCPDCAPTGMDVFVSSTNLVTPSGIVAPPQDTGTQYKINVESSLATTEAIYTFEIRGNFPAGLTKFAGPITLTVQCGPASTVIS